MKEAKRLQYFETEFINKRKSTVIVEEEGRELLRLEPGQKKFVESRDASTSYAAWSKIVYRENGKVDLHENHAWKFPLPEDKLMLTILNIDGKDTEQFYMSGNTFEPVLAYKNVPRFVAVDIHDPQWAFIARMEIRLVEHKEKSGDYFVTKHVLERVKTLRGPKEVKAIEKLLVEEAIAKAKADFKRRFPSAEA